MLRSRGTGKIVASTRSGIHNNNLLLWMKVPGSRGLQFLHLLHNKFTFIFIGITKSRSRRASEVVAPTRSSIRNYRLFRMKEPISGSFQLSRFFHDCITFVFRFLVVIVVLKSRRACEVTSSTCSCIKNDRLFRMKEPISSSFQLFQIFHDCITFVFYFLVIIVALRSRRACEVISSTCSCIRNNNSLFRKKEPFSSSFQLFQIFHDCITFIFHILYNKTFTDTRKSRQKVISLIILRSRRTCEVVPSTGSCIRNNNRLARMKKPISSSFQLF